MLNGGAGSVTVVMNVNIPFQRRTKNESHSRTSYLVRSRDYGSLVQGRALGIDAAAKAQAYKQGVYQVVACVASIEQFGGNRSLRGY